MKLRLAFDCLSEQKWKESNFRAKESSQDNILYMKLEV